MIDKGIRTGGAGAGEISSADFSAKSKGPSAQNMRDGTEAIFFHPGTQPSTAKLDNKSAQEKSQQASGDGACCDHWSCCCCCCSSDSNGGGGGGCDCDCDCDGC